MMVCFSWIPALYWIWTWIWICPLAQAERNSTIVSTNTTASATETGAATATATKTPSSPQPPSYTSQPDFQQSVLEVTNRYRSEHQAIHLVWNDTLTEYAHNWAKACIWKHSVRRPLKGPYGENLAFGYPNASSSICAWGDERSMYDFQLPTGYTEETGHFTQLVWRDTTDVGCAAVDCGYNADSDTDGEGGRPRRAKGWYVVCEYSPGGNTIAGGSSSVPESKPANWRYVDEDEEDPKKKWFRLNVLPAKKRTYPGSSSSSSSSSFRLRGSDDGYIRLVTWCMVLVHGLVLLL